MSSTRSRLTSLCFLSSPYASMARKRSAQEGVQGAPVNKRKSLLMKPRHYSPSEACEEESEDLAPPQDKEEPRNIDTPAGKQMSCCFVCFDEQLTLNFKIPSVAFLFPSLRRQPSSRSHCAVEVKDYTAGSVLVVHKLKFWQLICHDIFGVALPPSWWGQLSDPLICPSTIASPNPLSPYNDDLNGGVHQFTFIYIRRPSLLFVIEDARREKQISSALFRQKKFIFFTIS